MKKSESPYNIFSGFQARIVGWPTFSLIIFAGAFPRESFFFFAFAFVAGMRKQKRDKGGEVSPREKETRGVGREFRL